MWDEHDGHAVQNIGLRLITWRELMADKNKTLVKLVVVWYVIGSGVPSEVPYRCTINNILNKHINSTYKRKKKDREEERQCFHRYLCFRVSQHRTDYGISTYIASKFSEHL